MLQSLLEKGRIFLSFHVWLLARVTQFLAKRTGDVALKYVMV